MYVVVEILLGFDGHFVVDSRGASGCLMLFWKNSLDVSIESYSEGHIDCTDVIEECLFRFTGLYGNPNHSKRVHSWELLKRLACVGPADVPWVLGGDFNEILSQNEKCGGPPRPWAQILGFRMALDFCGLKSLTSNAAFSWYNQREETLQFPFDWTASLSIAKGLIPLENLLQSYGWDHRALSLTIRLESQPNNSSSKGYKRFHFEQKWMMQQDFAADTLMHWTSFDNSPLHVKLENCKLFLLAWTGKIFDNPTKELEILHKRRVSLLNTADANFNRTDLEEVNAQIEKMTEAEEIHWKQRSRANWLSLGDHNTKYFHNFASDRRRNNSIQCLLDPSGEVKKQDEEKAQIIQSYFMEMFESTKPSNDHIAIVTDTVLSKLSEDEANSLGALSYEEEVWRALFQMNPHKAPGPDGFPPIFFQKFWGEIGSSVTRDVLRVLNGEASIEDWNKTLITLITKVKKPTLVKDFRPISLCNTIYKMVAKVIANRLRGYLNSVIDETQSAFISGRLISDNVLLCYECMHWLHHHKSGKVGYAAAKLDMSKAYDRVEWDFLRAMMVVMNFSGHVVDLIMKCVMTVEFSFVVNRKVYGSLKPTRGIRQGCPLTFSVYDLLPGPVFPLEQLREARCLQRLTHCKKPQCLSWRDRASYKCLGHQRDYWPFYVLGIAVFLHEGKKLQFDYLRERVCKKLNAEGKEILIKSVIQSIPTYAMACFKIPDAICSSIQRLCANFWWGEKDQGHHLYWAKWERLCKPKSQGGLGFRHLAAFSKALLAKQAWHLITSPNSLVARVLKGRYYRDTEIMEAKVSCNSSFMWRSICWGRDLLEQGVRWKIGNGQRVRAFKDAWVPGTVDAFAHARQNVVLDFRHARREAICRTTT